MKYRLLRPGIDFRCIEDTLLERIMWRVATTAWQHRAVATEWQWVRSYADPRSAQLGNIKVLVATVHPEPWPYGGKWTLVTVANIAEKDGTLVRRAVQSYKCHDDLVMPTEMIAKTITLEPGLLQMWRENIAALEGITNAAP